MRGAMEAQAIRVAAETTCHARGVRIAIIIGSTRPNRKSEKVAKWVAEQGDGRDDAEFQLVDLADQGLPIFDEPKPPGAGDYQHEHTKRWGWGGALKGVREARS